MSHRGLMFFALWLSLWDFASGVEMRTASRMGAEASNQLKVAGNACGPAALLSAFRFGETRWDRPVEALGKETDREQILAIIRRYGGRSSHTLKDHQRWSKRGVNLADLTDIANEMARPFYLPRLKAEVFPATANGEGERTLKRTHGVLRKSLANGFPPILSVRRFVFRDGQWTVLSAHFVTLIALPERMEKGATSFPVVYLDPWGGRRCEGVVTVPENGFPSGLPANLSVNLPQTGVGKSLVKPGERSVVLLSAAIVR
ncbi:MAG: hypothetical protein QM627_07295 [Luteolibacter sp.]